MNVYWTYGGGSSMIPSNYNILVPSPFTTTFQIPPIFQNSPVNSTDAVNKAYVDNSFSTNSLWIYMSTSNWIEPNNNVTFPLQYQCQF